MEAYSQGDYTAIPSGTYGGTIFSPSAASTIKSRQHAAKQHQTTKSKGGSTSTGGTSGGTTGSTGGSTGSGLPNVDDTGAGDGGGLVGDLTGTIGGITGGGGSGGSTSSPAPNPVTNTLTRTEALAQCTLQGVVDLPLTGTNELEDCIARLMG
jgi:hypothetical protein